MYVSSRPKNNMLATKKSRKGVTLYEVKQQNNVEIVLVLCFLSLVETLKHLFYWLGSFKVKVAGCNFTNCNFTKINFFYRVFGPTTFRQLLLFIAFTQVVFTEKVCFIQTTSFNSLFTETWSIQRNQFCHFLAGTHY